MLDLDAWREIAQIIRRNKLRTSLTAAGVFWGMFMLLLMQGFGTGMENGVQRSMGDNVSNSVYLWSRSTSLPYKGRRPGRSVSMRNADVDALTAELPDIAYLAPRLQLGGFRSGTTIKRGEKVGSFQVMGDAPAYVHVQPMSLVEGRFVNPIDMAQRRKVVVIGQQIYEELFDVAKPAVGQRLTVQGIDFLVVGRFKAKVSGDDGDRIESVLHIPFSTFQRAFNSGDRVGWVAMTAQDGASGEALEADAKRILSERHAVHPDDKLAFGSYNAQEEYQRMQNLFGGMRVLVWFVGAMTLLSGVVGVSNVMLISVAERTREIGVRRAIGASRAEIVWMILREALVLTSVAGYAGLLAGVLATEGLGLLVGDSSDVLSEPSVDIGAALAAAGLLVVAGTLSGLLPAWRAANIHPVEALRAE